MTCSHECNRPRFRNGQHVLVCMCGKAAHVDPGPLKHKQMRVFSWIYRRA
jgi:hypothetical protein